MVNTNNAQEWLNQVIPQNEWQEVEELCILSEDSEGGYYEISDLYTFLIPTDQFLTGTLNLSNFSNLKRVNVEGQLITKLDLTGCQQLRVLKANDNRLQEIVWPQFRDNQIPSLKDINLSNNNFPARDLSEFRNFTNLVILSLGTNDRDRINWGIYNRWTGSLEPLKNLHELVALDINGTDINGGIEHLPTKELSCFVFGNSGRDNAGVNNIQSYLKEKLELGIEGDVLNDWASDKGNYDDVDMTYEKVGDICNWVKIQQERVRQAILVRIEANSSHR